MWIRTQNKMMLVECNKFEILDNEIIFGSPFSEYIALGSYATHERCLEVLDEIEECIDLDYVPIRKINARTQERKVYQMPEEELK